MRKFRKVFNRGASLVIVAGSKSCTGSGLPTTVPSGRFTLHICNGLFCPALWVLCCRLL